MGQEEALLPAVVCFSWEHEQGMPAVEARGMPASPRKGPASATLVLSREHEPAMTKPMLARRLSVPPPPGRPRSVSRAVRPEDDPFLAAYLACTKSAGGSRRGGEGGKKRTGARDRKKGQRRFGWARLVLGLGGLSCKRDSSVVEQSMVRLAKLPEVDPRDA